MIPDEAVEAAGEKTVTMRYTITVEVLPANVQAYLEDGWVTVDA